MRNAPPWLGCWGRPHRPVQLGTLTMEQSSRHYGRSLPRPRGQRDLSLPSLRSVMYYPIDVMGTGDPSTSSSLGLFSWVAISLASWSRRFSPIFRFTLAPSCERISPQGIELSPGWVFTISIFEFCFPCQSRFPALTHIVSSKFYPSYVLLLRARLLIYLRANFLSAVPIVIADLQIVKVLRESPSPEFQWVLRVGPPSPSPISFVPVSPISWVHSTLFALVIQVLPTAFSPSCIFVTAMLTHYRPKSVASFPPRSQIPGKVSETLQTSILGIASAWLPVPWKTGDSSWPRLDSVAIPWSRSRFVVCSDSS